MLADGSLALEVVGARVDRRRLLPGGGGVRGDPDRFRPPERSLGAMSYKVGEGEDRYAMW